MDNFNKQKQIDSMSKAVNKLVDFFKEKGVDFYHLHADERNAGLENVTFVSESTQVKISHHSFYRYSGISQITRPKADANGKETNWTETFPVTDEIYMQQFMKPIIEILLMT